MKIKKVKLIEPMCVLVGSRKANKNYRPPGSLTPSLPATLS